MPSSPEADEESACLLSPLRLLLSDPELFAVTLPERLLFSVQELLGVAVDLELGRLWTVLPGIVQMSRMCGGTQAVGGLEVDQVYGLIYLAVMIKLDLAGKPHPVLYGWITH